MNTQNPVASLIPSERPSKTDLTAGTGMPFSPPVNWSQRPMTSKAARLMASVRRPK